MNTAKGLVMLVLFIAGCSPGSRTKETSQTEVKWEYQEISWPTEDRIKLYGWTNVHTRINFISENGSDRKREIYDRAHALTVLGEGGWEPIWISPSGNEFILKGNSATCKSFSFDTDIDFTNYEKARDKEWAESKKRTDEILHPHDANADEFERIVAENAAQDAKRRAADKERAKRGVENTIKWTREQADAGDAFGQLRMGERYLQGDGVEKDLVKAREYLTKAATQGNADAQELLQKLSEPRLLER